MAAPVPLRAHQVLCLMGFRGEGYSPAFVDEMARLQAELRSDPQQPIRLLTAPDRLCMACVHLGPKGCTLGGPDHEAHMRAQDEVVLDRLGLARGQTYPWNLIEQRIADTVRGTDLPAICTTCPWLDLGWCAEGVERLAAGRGEQPPFPT